MKPEARVTPQVLSGWKEIATYLGKGVRTVQRYEWELQLPVRRPAGKARGSVIATREELDAWVAASPIRESYHISSRPESTNSLQCEAIRTGIQEMRRLREQMMDLRADVHTSLNLLGASIRGMADHVAAKGVDEIRSDPGAPDGSWESKRILTLIKMSADRKAS